MAGGQERVLGAGSRASSRRRRSPGRWSSSPPRRSSAPRTASPPHARPRGHGPHRPRRQRRRRGGTPAACSGPRRRSRTSLLSVVADRGLCGAYNSTVSGATDRLIAGQQKGINYRLFTPASGPGYFRFRRQPVEQSFAGFSDRPTFERARAGDQGHRDAVRRREVDQVLVVSTRFLSAGSSRSKAPAPALVDPREPSPTHPDGSETAGERHSEPSEAGGLHRIRARRRRPCSRAAPRRRPSGYSPPCSRPLPPS